MAKHLKPERGNKDRKPGSPVNRVRNLQRTMNRQAASGGAYDALADPANSIKAP